MTKKQKKTLKRIIIAAVLTAVLALLYLFATDALRLIGAASALFGRQGAVSGWIKKYKDTHDKED